METKDVTIELVVVPFREWKGKIQDTGRVEDWGTANPKVRMRWPFHRVLFAKHRFEHEVDHILYGRGDSSHHPWKHFCVRVSHALRIKGEHVDDRTRSVARELRRHGKVVTQAPVWK